MSWNSCFWKSWDILILESNTVLDAIWQVGQAGTTNDSHKWTDRTAFQEKTCNILIHGTAFIAGFSIGDGHLRWRMEEAISLGTSIWGCGALAKTIPLVTLRIAFLPFFVFLKSLKCNPLIFLIFISRRSGRKLKTSSHHKGCEKVNWKYVRIAYLYVLWTQREFYRVVLANRSCAFSLLCEAKFHTAQVWNIKFYLWTNRCWIKQSKNMGYERQQLLTCINLQIMTSMTDFRLKDDLWETMVRRKTFYGLGWSYEVSPKYDYHKNQMILRRSVYTKAFEVLFEVRRWGDNILDYISKCGRQLTFA